MGMNKIHFRRLSIFASFSGCLLGYLCAEADDNLQLIMKNYEHTIKKALI